MWWLFYLRFPIYKIMHSAQHISYTNDLLSAHSKRRKWCRCLLPKQRTRRLEEFIFSIVICRSKGVWDRSIRRCSSSEKWNGNQGQLVLQRKKALRHCDGSRYWRCRAGAVFAPDHSQVSSTSYSLLSGYFDDVYDLFLCLNRFLLVLDFCKIVSFFT